MTIEAMARSEVVLNAACAAARALSMTTPRNKQDAGTEKGHSFEEIGNE